MNAIKMDLPPSRKPLTFLAILCAGSLSSAALAQTPPNAPAFCAERPGQTTPPCVIEPGSAMVEIGLATWEHATTESERHDQFTLGTSSLRYGVVPRLELQVGWAGVAVSSHFDYGTQDRSRTTNPGDLTVGALYGLSGPDGLVAIQTFLTLPTGKDEATAGDWSAGVRLPVAIAINSDWQLGLTPEYDRATNASGHGQHSAFGGAAGLSRSISDQLGAGVDISIMEDRDPEGSSTKSTASASIAWQASPDTQFDVGAGFGLTRSSPRLQIYIGFAKRL